MLQTYFTLFVLGTSLAALITGLLLSKATFMANFQKSTYGNVVTILLVASSFIAAGIRPNDALKVIAIYVFFAALTLGMRRKTAPSDSAK